jgi:L-lactate dehydrogenase complex protein LldG
MTETAIISAIQRGLRRGPLPPDQQDMLRTRMANHPRHPTPARARLDHAGQVNLFCAYVEREFGTVDRLPSLADVPAAIATYLAAQNIAPSLVVSPHPDLQSIPFETRPLLTVRFGTTTPSDTVCLTHAFAGIAETGTLMLPSGPHRPTTNNLLPDNALVVLAAADIVGVYEDAFDKLREAGPIPRNIMLVTGPSRSADIEQTLELGAHGPRRLHLLVIDGPA